MTVYSAIMQLERAFLNRIRQSFLLQVLKHLVNQLVLQWADDMGRKPRGFSGSIAETTN